MDTLIKEVLNARVYDVAVMTPLDTAEKLSARLDNHVLLKREDLQPCYSFKVRGAYNKIFHLTPREKAQGVICASAGNHAQGVALAAKHLSIAATIVMPVTTPGIKVDAVRALGGEVVLSGDHFSEAYDHACKLKGEAGAIFIHPFDDPLVIAGQGTIGHELIQQCPDLDMVFVPVGGGGLIAGIAGFVKSLRPQVRIIGVEPEGSDAMRQSTQAGSRVNLDEVSLFADGVAVRQVGSLTFPLVQAHVDEIITVTTDEICSALKSIYEDTRSIVEPAGALAVAGLRRYVSANAIRGQRIVAINSGANMNFDRLHFVAERARTGEMREALFAVTIPEKPGALRFFCEQLVEERMITEFNYRLNGRSEAQIFVGISIRSGEERESFRRKLEKHGYGNIDLTDNELAKSHVRHMVGGKSLHRQNEVLYSFEFPERPKALLDFLLAMEGSWNISLFHYRMHGGDFGRVLVGMEIPEADKGLFGAFLNKLQYHYQDETDNPVYRLFL